MTYIHIGMHQCYYCGQMFDTKEKLYDHLEIHTDAERNSEIMARSKEKAERVEAREEDGGGESESGGEAGGGESESGGEAGGGNNRTAETQ